MNRFPIITLTTDYGIDNGYVASVKGVILGINPGAIIVDICHTIRPQNILEAAFIIGTLYTYFPARSIHIIVVDPGVGSSRKSVLLEMGSGLFIAPDNGVLSYILADKVKAKIKSGAIWQMKTHRRKVPHDCRVIEINNPQYWLKPVSRTFHGRDIFAPVAAYLSRNMPREEFGTLSNYINLFSPPMPYTDSRGYLHGQVMHIDSFGNMITNISEKSLRSKWFVLKVGKLEIRGLQQYYAAGKGLMALIGSSNYLEIALKNGSARDYLGANIGDLVLLEFT